KLEATDNANEGSLDPSQELQFTPDKPENEETLNVLLIGVDTEENEPARTDTIMVAQYSPKDGTAKLASIMRDSYVSIPGYQDNKINAAFFFGGPELLRQTIKENFDLDVHYYAMVNFDGFVSLVDAIAPNGIELDIKNRMYYQSSNTYIDFQPGVQTLDGQQALNYVRFRSDSNNDFGRVARQQEMLSLLKDELLSLSGLTRVPRLIGQIEPYIDTNITTGKVISLGRDFLLNPVEEIETLRIPIENGYVDRTYSHAGQVLELDFEKNRQAISAFFNPDQENTEMIMSAHDHIDDAPYEEGH
ncbi:LCP family protein, partial [Halalkalibacterium ligniniphilum]